MKRLGYLLLLCTVIFSESYAQKVLRKPLTNENSQKVYPIDGTPILEARNTEVYNYFKQNPQALTSPKMRKAKSWGFTVGTQRSFYAYNFSTQARYSSSFTCRAVGANCYVFVEDSLWGNRVNQVAVDSVVNAFDLRTPANPHRGVFEMDTTAFGQPPNVDNDPRIVILILNIQDGFKGTGGFTAGYFDSYNEMTNTILYPKSNAGEFYYIDADPLNLNTTSGLTFAMQTTAHEFQHMINFNYHSGSPIMTFINEGCSKLAEIYCGYPIFDQSLYEDETNYYLFGWRGNNSTLVLNDYARAQRFFLYFWDHFGIGIFKYIVQSQYDGIPLLNYSLKQDGQSLTFNDIFPDWLIANSLDDTAYNKYYGYTYPNLYKAHATTYYNPNDTGSDDIYNLGADYLTFSNGNNLKITFSSSSSSIMIKAIELGNNAEQVVDVPLNNEFDVPDFGTTYSSITFVVMNTDQSNHQSYTFQSSGTAISSVQDMKWDNTKPSGYYKWSPSDTICVAFDALAGGTLDSIRVALRRAGSINGGVWQFTGNIQPTPLGKKLATVTASINTTTSVPYPVPYQNWTSVDLRSYSISTDNPFAVGFVIGTDPGTPGVMVTDYTPSQGPYHSFTYLQASDGVSTPNWYYIGRSDTTEIYLIHAYVGLNSVSGVKTVELTPSNFSLSQNYPNPFNPSTTIRFTIPKEEKVVVKVYNQLGQQVALLTNQAYQKGQHELKFDALNLSSGIYYYRIEAGDFIQTRKMVLLK